MEARRPHYNRVRPYSSLGCLTPLESRQQCDAVLPNPSRAAPLS
ncbi:hypothetical protein JGU66_35955 [Myxococcaceae bacterium JPH2]|nr:hypothetical protein [Myxococcaceae bacterium JPH2]